MTAVLFNFSAMANSPRDGQQFVGFKLDEKLLGLVDKARGFADRSLFFRQAIAEKLKTLGVTVTDDLVFPPTRARDRSEIHTLNCHVAEDVKTPGTALKPKRIAYPKAAKKPRKNS